MSKIIWTKIFWQGVAVSTTVVTIGAVVIFSGAKGHIFSPAALENFLQPKQTQKEAPGPLFASATPARSTQKSADSSVGKNKTQDVSVPPKVKQTDKNNSSRNIGEEQDQSQESSSQTLGNATDVSTPDENVQNIPQIAHVARVIDGDTIVLSTGEHLRYIGINAPEISHDGFAADCYGEEAAARDRELVEGKDVVLTVGPDNLDIYGRLLRYVWVGDMLINQELILEGDARANDYGHPHPYDGQFAAAELQAKDAERGLWGACNKKTAKEKQITDEKIPAVQINKSLVINEVRPQGDEFVELYNPTDTPASLAGYYFAYYSHTQTSWDSPSRVKKFPDDAAIPAHAYYFIAFGGAAYALPKEDWRPYTSDTLSNSAGSVALYAGDPREVGAVNIDAFGWGNTLLSEFAPASGTPQDAQTFARPTDRTELDHNNNSFDFQITTIPTPGFENRLLAPQNDPSLQPASSSGVTPAQVVISEVLVNGAEFVELYNPTLQAQSLTGHYLTYYSSSKTAWSDPLSDKKFPDGSTVPPHGYFLVDVDGGNYPAAQWTPASFSSLNNSQGTIAIFPLDPKTVSVDGAKAAIIDAVAWGDDTKVTLKETKTVQAPAAGQSISRDLQKDDTNDNSKDFFVTSPTPGSVNAQSSGPQDSGQQAPAPADNLSDVVINEIETGDSEFVELYNPSDSAVDLSGYFFAYYSSSKTAWSDPYRIQQFSAGSTIPAAGFYLIGFNYAVTDSLPTLDWQPYTSNTLSNSSGTVAIFAHDPTQINSLCACLPTDAVGWGNASLKEGQAAPAPASGQSISRDVAHDDTDNNSADFTTLLQPTPTNSSM